MSFLKEFKTLDNAQLASLEFIVTVIAGALATVLVIGIFRFSGSLNNSQIPASCKCDKKNESSIGRDNLGQEKERGISPSGDQLCGPPGDVGVL